MLLAPGCRPPASARRASIPTHFPLPPRRSTWQPGGHASPPPPIAHRHRVNVASLTLSTLFFPHFNKLWGMPQLRPLLQWLGIL